MKKTLSVTLVVLSLILAFTLSFLISRTVTAKKFEYMLHSGHDKAFYELLENVDKIDTALKKSALIKDSSLLISLGADIRECSSFAVLNLGVFESDIPLTNINKFLNQSGDYVKAVAKSHSDGSDITKEEQDNFLMLSGFSSILKRELFLLRDKLASGEISYSSALKEADETLGEHLSSIEAEHFSSFSPLSYDGTFSSHMESLNSPYLSSLPEINKEDALKAALSYLSGNISLVFTGESEGQIPSYMFSYESEDASYSMELSKNGGKLLYYTESRPVRDTAVGTDEALFHALTFTKEAGFPSMEAVFYENSGSLLTVSLAPYTNGVIYYSDMIKVTIALDDASVVGFNASSYLLNHKERTFPEGESLSYDTLAKINPEFSLKSVNKVFIPNEYGGENACIEALGTFRNDTFLIYINSETGKEEEILLLSEEEESYFTR